MRFGSCFTVLAALVAAVSAAPPVDKRDTLAYRAWDLRLFSDAIPVCNPDNSNINLSIMHNYGRGVRACSALNTAMFNETNVKSLSWKTTESDWHDFCMWSTPDCSGGETSLLGNITNRWNICYPYNGFVAYSVVEQGHSCL